MKLEDKFLAKIVADQINTTVFLTNGVKLSGYLSTVVGDTLALTRDGITQLVYRHAIATVMPQSAIDVDGLMMEDK